jgi:hypothetical protein
MNVYSHIWKMYFLIFIIVYFLNKLCNLYRLNGGMTMLMKTFIAAAVALGCVLAVPSASFAQGDKDKSATATASPKAPASKSHKKPKKKGYAGPPEVDSR